MTKCTRKIYKIKMKPENVLLSSSPWLIITCSISDHNYRISNRDTVTLCCPMTVTSG